MYFFYALAALTAAAIVAPKKWPRTAMPLGDRDPAARARFVRRGRVDCLRRRQNPAPRVPDGAAAGAEPLIPRQRAVDHPFFVRLARNFRATHWRYSGSPSETRTATISGTSYGCRDFSFAWKAASRALGRLEEDHRLRAPARPSPASGRSTATAGRMFAQAARFSVTSCSAIRRAVSASGNVLNASRISSAIVRPARAPPAGKSSRRPARHRHRKRPRPGRA